MLSRGLLTTLQMFCLCLWHLSKTQAPLISNFACHNLFEKEIETLTKCCLRILMINFAEFYSDLILQFCTSIKIIQNQVRCIDFKTLGRMFQALVDSFRNMARYLKTLALIYV